MDIVINARGREFKCIEAHYPRIYRLGGTMNNSRHCVKKSRYNQNL